jgi:hypothetical protein
LLGRKSSIKKHCTTIAGKEIFNMFASAMNNVDPTAHVIVTMMEPCNRAAKC